MDLYDHRERPDNDVSTPSTSVSGGSVSQGSNVSDGAYISGLGYTREDLIRALEDSRDVWLANRDFSMEAYKASELLGVLLNSLKLPFSPSNPPHTQLPIGTQQGPGSNNDEQTAAMTLGMLQSGGMGSTGQLGNLSQIGSPGGQWNAKGANAGFGSNTDSSGTFGAGTANAPSPFPTSFFGGAIDNFGQNMSLDWEAWDQYMQPSNLSLDPAANLWSTNSPSNNLFTQTSSSDGAGDGSFGMSGMYPPSIGSMMGGPPDLTKSSTQMPNLSANSTSGSNDQSAGEVFMGVESPQPGGIPSWKWTVGLNDKK